METVVETPLRSPVQSENTLSGCKTPPTNLEMGQKAQNSGQDSGSKNATPAAKSAKAFEYPERYRSPTDLMMSPISKGLLARSRKTCEQIYPLFCTWLIWWPGSGSAYP